MGLSRHARQKCIAANCGSEFEIGRTMTSCSDCNGLLDIVYDWDKLPLPDSLSELGRYPAGSPQPPQRRSGVWRFHELLPFADLESCLSVGEGQTILQQADGLARALGMKPAHLFLQYEGLNPSGSFKDNGMAAALTHAKLQTAKRVACASTGNTSASLALFAAATGCFRAIIFVGSGKIAYGKLSQALDYGALTLQIKGDFDDAMAAVQEICQSMGIYLVNSVNPFRLEGQKTIMLRVLEGMNWEVPDWIIVPGGNLGNSSAFGKVFGELKQLGLIDRIPRLAIINAAGASTLDQLVNQQGYEWKGGSFDLQRAHRHFAELQNSGMRANTVASAIEINLPVNLSKCLRAIEITDGVVRSVSDTDILNAKALVGKYGFGCEPASGASVAGVQLLRSEGLIADNDRVACILTGHILKDPNATVGYHTDDDWRSKKSIGDPTWANQPIAVDNDIDAIVDVIDRLGGTD